MAPFERLRGVLLLVLLTLGWGLCMLQFGEQEIYASVGYYALFVCLTLAMVHGPEVRGWLRSGLREVAIGVGLGVIMTALTYPLYRLAAAWVPSLTPTVARLYRSSHEGSLVASLCWVVVIIVAEELLFRGAFLALLEDRISRPAAVFVSTFSYAAAQTFSGSLLVGLLALCCGTLWALERMLTGSLVAPLLSHLIWTPVVIVICPVIG